MAMKVVRGKRLRITRVDRCGLPIPGPKNQLVTKGFVTVTISNQMKDAEDLEQTNADGEVCVADRTAPEIKWQNVEISLCEVDPEALSIMAKMPQVLDYANRPVGFRIGKTVPVEEGFALELWSGTAGSDCDTPTNDDIFAATAPSTEYGYWLAPAVVEGVIGDIEIGASVTTFNLSGRAVAGPRWGRGPYNVVPIDDQNTPGRLLSPMPSDEYTHMQKTTIAPPAVTGGAAPLTLPTGLNYFEGGGDDVVEDVVAERTVTVEGAEGGSFTLSLGGQTTAGIAFDATPEAVESELLRLSNVPAGTVSVTGEAGGPYTISLSGGAPRNLSANDSGLTPDGTVTVV